MASISEKTAKMRTMEQRMGALSAVLMPLIELGALGFGAYVFIYLLCIQYLIRPSSDLQSRGISPRKSTGIALIVVFCILLLVLMVTWMRLLQVIWTNPGLVPLGDSLSEKEATSTKYFDRYDAYIADYGGWPLWCDKCKNFKPDRSHHCRELGRCVRRMDHYCPWAGGIISETTHKFFVQFVFYGAFLTAFIWLPLAIFLAERIRILGSKPVQWIAALALGAIFCVFTTTMFFTTFWNVTINYTTIESLQRGGVQNIAILASQNRPKTSRRSSHSSPTSPGRDPSKHSRRPSTVTPTSPPSTTSRPPNPDPPTVLREISRDPSRTYVLFQTQPFVHPWDMGTWPNLRSIMGDSLIDWFIPLKMSPCIDHSDPHGEFGWADEVLDMARAYRVDKPETRFPVLSGAVRRGSR